MKKLIDLWKPILTFTSKMVEELPESKWEEYALMFQQAEETYKESNPHLLRYLVPVIRRTGKYPEVKFNDYGEYYEMELTSDITGKEIVVGIPLDKEMCESLPWYRIMLLGFIIPKYTFLISPTMEELYPAELKDMRSIHDFGVDV